MEAFFRTHAYLVEHTNAPVRRMLMDEIDWNDRMIGIKGTRGIGKTTFLLQYAKENFDVNDRRCLYINMNNFYFQGRGIFDFAGDFYKNGGRVLLIDQVFKEPNWSKQLRDCYDKYDKLKIVFTGSSVMRLKEENPELNGIVKSYNLRGFSFREFLNLQTGNNFRPYTMKEIINDHEHLIKHILPKVIPKWVKATKSPFGCLVSYIRHKGTFVYSLIFYLFKKWLKKKNLSLVMVMRPLLT